MRELDSATGRRRERGNALIEFALSSTLLMIILAGVIGFSRLFNAACVAQGAAEAGVQYGALSPANTGDLAGMQTVALSDAGAFPGATATASQFCTCSVGGTQVSCPASCGTGTGQTYIQVVVTIPFQPIINYPLLPNLTTVSQMACARVQ